MTILFNKATVLILILLALMIPSQATGFGKVLGTDIHGAAINGDLKGIKKMIERKVVDVDKTQSNGNTALQFAASNGHHEIVNYLIENGADLNHQDKQGQTALSDAAAHNCVKCVHALISAGADIERTDQVGRTPLAYAVKNGWPQVSKILINAGARKNVIDAAGISIADYASSLSGDKSSEKDEILRALASLDVDAANENGFVELAKGEQSIRPQSTNSLTGLQTACDESDSPALDKNENRVLRYLIRKRFNQGGLSGDESLCVESINVLQSVELAGDSIVQFSATLMFPQGYKTECLKPGMENDTDCAAKGASPQTPGARVNYKGEEAI